MSAQEHTPAKVAFSTGDMNRILEMVEPSLGAEDFQLVKTVFQTFLTIFNQLQKKSVTLGRIRRLLFGPTSEKRKNLLKDNEKNSESEGHSDSSQKPGSNKDSKKKKKESKGHGRNGEKDFPGADREQVKHESLTENDPCPDCGKKTLNKYNNPAMQLYFYGQPLVGCTIFELERLRCSNCGTLATAPVPEKAKPGKYNATAAAVIAYARFGQGIPHNRIQKSQKEWGIPLSASTQWKVIAERFADLRPAYDEIVVQSAQGMLFYNDDTPNHILELNNNPDLDRPERSGIFTSAIVSQFDGKQAVIYSTGRNHAGENLDAVLQHRQEGLDPPLQMCDGLDRNIPKSLEAILSNCICHGRRKFVDLINIFPEECHRLIDDLAEIYQNEDEAKELKLTPEARLELHRKKSAPILNDLFDWMDKQINEKEVEPNSSLGQAIEYMRSRREEMTRFLHIPGAPLDNNLCERMLKGAILHRKNSLFYKTRRGAAVGDLYMSLIFTCALNGISALDYLVTLLQNHTHVRDNPSDWMPWSYQKTVQSMA